jgi:hypothetical protein
LISTKIPRFWTDTSYKNPNHQLPLSRTTVRAFQLYGIGIAKIPFSREDHVSKALRCEKGLQAALIVDKKARTAPALDLDIASLNLMIGFLDPPPAPGSFRAGCEKRIRPDNAPVPVGSGGLALGY